MWGSGERFPTSGTYGGRVRRVPLLPPYLPSGTPGGPPARALGWRPATELRRLSRLEVTRASSSTNDALPRAVPHAVRRAPSGWHHASAAVPPLLAGVPRRRSEPPRVDGRPVRRHLGIPTDRGIPGYGPALNFRMASREHTQVAGIATRLQRAVIVPWCLSFNTRFEQITGTNGRDRFGA